MRKRSTLGAAFVLMASAGIGIAGAGPVSAAHTTCHQTTPFLGTFSNGEANEDGLISGTIHDNAETVEHRLNPDQRPIHYVNCTIIAPNDPT
jgi:hypothetical protein